MINRVGGDAILAEMRTHSQGVTCCLDLNDKIVTRPRKAQVGRIQAIQLNDINLIGSCFAVRVVVDAVLTIPFCKAVSVRTATAIKRIVASATIKDVVTISAIESIATGVASQQIVPFLAIQVV
ncbi:hypothetical protein ALQ88_200209 [Pseudomonas savastanoi]|nr:hypothetical protein ALQ88_200209 [Pseudomonas savastanoi]